MSQESCPRHSKQELFVCCTRKETEDLNNWRPISLLNTDYKIITKALANWLKSVMGTVIHPDQTCTILKQSIHDNCATVRCLSTMCCFYQPAAVISLDQKKASDHVNWTYLGRVCLL